MQWENYDAVLFDLDGVITPTADVHMRSWSVMFNAFLPTYDADLAPYTDEDYFQHVDGKPRYDGVRAFLASRGITLPDGTPEDTPDQLTVCGLGNRKNEAFAEVLRSEKVTPFPGSVALLDVLADRGTKMAIVSSSRNAPLVLEAAGLADRFGVVVDGKVAGDANLPGKPLPDTFQYAAEQLGVPQQRCIVVEDVVSGVQAGAAGDFGLVVGVDRGAGADALQAAGADVVVTDLAELIA